MSEHRIRTTHIRTMLENALRCAQLAEDEQDPQALQAAAVECTHANGELSDEWARSTLRPDLMHTR